ncbi:hypothetical protein [Planctopirus ephydatiae]|uniref:hypothetical protein n=1 Tax=Planctopirus ephydatiae TaxID=2528019 RepID=UPI0011A5EDC7|nr:hypothetical protein [Planctopirus ephydatiae]
MSPFTPAIDTPTGSTTAATVNFDFLQTVPSSTAPSGQGEHHDDLKSFVFPSPQLPGADEFPIPSLGSIIEGTVPAESPPGMPSFEPAHAVTSEPEEEVVFDFIPDSQPVIAPHSSLQEISESFPAMTAETLDPTLADDSHNSPAGLPGHTIATTIDPSLSNDLHTSDPGTDHFSQSSPQLAELIRQTAGVGLTTAEPAMSFTEALMPVDASTQGEGDSGTPDFPAVSTSNVPSISAGTEINSAEDQPLAFLSNIDQPSVAAQPPQTNLDVQQLSSFSQLAQPFPTGEDLNLVSNGATSEKRSADKVQEGDFQFSSQPVPVGSLSTGAADAFQENPATLRREDVVSRQLFLLLAGYASASTLALLFFIVQYMRQPYHQLESLPDIKPPATGISVTLINPDNRVAPLHTLNLNQTRRFGNIEFTPLKVTRGPISIVENASNSSSETTEPVLKLLVRFKNVSRDQTIIPLDRELVFFRDRRVSSRANQFIKWADQLASDTGVINLFELPLQDEVSIANMPLGIALAPGESIETFLPSEAGGIDELNGNLIWRLQFRKGQNPRSGYPVTTLVDVQFNSEAIEREATAS